MYASDSAVLVSLDELEPAERLAALDQLLFVERQVVEVRPPLRLFLAAVIVEEVREELLRLVAGQEPLAHRVALIEPLLRLLLDLTLLGRRAPGQLARPLLQQPLVQLVQRTAVLLVVDADLLEQRVLPSLEPLLEVDDGLAPAGDLGRPLEAVQLLHGLDRVARERGAERLAHDPVEVDEHLAAEEVVDLALARAVLAHQAAERGALVGGVVVDVHAGEAAAALDDQVDEPLEAGLLLGAVAGPDAVVARLPVVVEVDPAEEVLEPAGRLEPGVALEVEPDVARVRLGHEREAALGLDRQQLDPVLAVPPVMELELGLEPEPGERRWTHLRDARAGRRVAEPLERRDPAAEASRLASGRCRRRASGGRPPPTAACRGRGSRRARSARPGTGRSAGPFSTAARKRPRRRR